jgi:hypothetical protein
MGLLSGAAWEIDEVGEDPFGESDKRGTAAARGSTAALVEVFRALEADEDGEKLG